MKPLPVYLINKNSGQKYLLDTQTTNTIGRGIDNENPVATIILPDTAISREHASIVFEPGSHQWVFCNLSRNGSLLNYEAVEKEKLKNGDCLQIGSFELLFYEKAYSNDETMEVPFPKKNISSFAKDWENTEATPFGTKIEAIVLVALIILSIFLFFCCFVW